MKAVVVIVSLLLGVVLFAAIILYFVGASLPERHTQQASLTLAAPRVTVWRAITDYEKMPAWWPDVKSVHFEKRPNGEVWTWNQDSHGQSIAFRTLGERAPEQLIREIVGENLPFGGTWTFDLAEVGGQTRLTITEDGFIKPPLFRAISRYFIGMDKTMKSFLGSLEKHLSASK